MHKIEHIMNDTFVITSGLPDAVESHAAEMANFAIELMSRIRNFVAEGVQIQFKTGLHSGLMTNIYINSGQVVTSLIPHLPRQFLNTSLEGKKEANRTEGDHLSVVFSSRSMCCWSYRIHCASLQHLWRICQDG